jgi:hypothetical protein
MKHEGIQHRRGDKNKLERILFWQIVNDSEDVVEHSKLLGSWTLSIVWQYKEHDVSEF